jgi:hypothetical protein
MSNELESQTRKPPARRPRDPDSRFAAESGIGDSLPTSISRPDRGKWDLEISGSELDSESTGGRAMAVST